MLSLDIRHLAVVAWLAINGVLIQNIGQQVGWGDQLGMPEPVIKALPPETIEVQVMSDYLPPPLAKRYLQTLSRPVFVPTRRPSPPPPPPPPPQPPPKPVMQKGQFLLVGVLMLPETSLVWLKELATGKTRKVEKGQKINGIQVQEIEPESVVLAQYEETERLGMKIAPSPVTQPSVVSVNPDAGKASRTPAAKTQLGLTPASKQSRNQPGTPAAINGNNSATRNPNERGNGAKNEK